MPDARRTRSRWSLVIGALLALLVAACGQPEDKRPVAKLVYVDWSESIGMTYVARIILEERLGFRVEMRKAKDLDDAFSSVANGTADAFLNTWLPITHKVFIDRYGGDLVDIGINYKGCRIGLAVPMYVPIESIDELVHVEDRFGGKIWGIDDDAGVMPATRKAIKEYGLEFELLTSSSREMTDALTLALDAKEWIIITAWKPHWKFAKWRLKFLADPKGLYEPSENIHTVARKGLPEEKPRLTSFLRHIRLETYQLESLMLEILPHRADPEPAVRSWMAGEAALIEAWIGKAQKEADAGEAGGG